LIAVRLPGCHVLTIRAVTRAIATVKCWMLN
jgi:hypothetical protein